MILRLISAGAGADLSQLECLLGKILDERFWFKRFLSGRLKL